MVGKAPFFYITGHIFKSYYSMGEKCREALFSVKHPNSSFLKCLGWKWVCSIFLLSLFINVALFYTIPHPIVKDAKIYKDIAINIMERHVVSKQTDPPYFSSIARVPGYPFFLAIIFNLFGKENEIAVCIIQSILSFILILIIAKLLLSITNNLNLCKIYCILAISFIFFHAYNSFLLREALVSFLLGLQVYLMFNLITSKKIKTVIGMGILHIVTVLVSPQTLLFPLLFFFLCIYRYPLKTVASWVLIYSVIFFILISPWVYRNYLLTKSFILTDVSGAGWALWAGSVYDHKMWDLRSAKNITEEERFDSNRFFSTDLVERINLDNKFKQRALRIIKNDPINWFGKIPEKVFYLWVSSYEDLLFDDVSPEFQRILIKAGVYLINLTYLGLAIMGFISMLTAYAFPRMFFFVPFYFTLIHSIMWPENRYIIPSWPFLMVFVAYGIMKLMRLFLMNGKERANI